MKSLGGFTLVEMMVVLIVIAILSTITLKLRRGQIDDMRAMNEREQWLSWHKKWNNLASNTNYFSGEKTSYFIFSYTKTGVTLSTSGGIEHFNFQKNTLSGQDIIINKKALDLGCTANQTTIELVGSSSQCFTLNTTLCTWTPCAKTR